MVSRKKQSASDTVALSREILASTSSVIILAGAGMSADIGTPVYWTGDNNKYGDLTSIHGYTALEHAHAPLWREHPLLQAQYFQEAYEGMLTRSLPYPSENPYHLLKAWLEENHKTYFTVTSNIDTAFIRQGYAADKLYEIHGAYSRSQCLLNPKHHAVHPTVDPSVGLTFCPSCENISRPNVLFFNDFFFNDSYTVQQEQNFNSFREAMVAEDTIILEIGVGLTVLNLRNITRKLYRIHDIPVIRINPIHVRAGDHLRTMKSPIFEHQLTSTAGLKELIM